jgi:DNA-binding XRE family transcriptional regulator
MHNRTLAPYVRTLRRRWALTQQELAQLIGYDERCSVCRIESGMRSPTIESALALEILFGTPTRSLFPQLYSTVEEAVMRRAAAQYEAVIRLDTPSSRRKRELLELVMKRAIDPSKSSKEYDQSN